MAFSFSRHSLDLLAQVHPDLQRVAYRALELTPIDFAVISGLRTLEAEAAFLASGLSQTMNSRHLSGMAIDVEALPNAIGSWDKLWYNKIADAFQSASMEFNIPIIWGGNWKTLKDYDHFELDRHYYPDPTTGVNEV